jgi:hypothetical protein
MTQNNQESLIFSENPSLSRRQIRAIPFFVFARNIEEGSRNAKISRSCFKRWWRNEAFRQEFHRVRDEIMREAIGRLQLSLHRAVDVMADLLDAQEKTIRLRAAQGIIENFFRIKETNEFEERLEKIEAVLFERKGSVL